MTKIYRSGASLFLVARQILHFLPFQRLSFSKFLYVQAVHRHPWLAYCSQPEGEAGQSASQMHPSIGNACTFFTISSSRDPLIAAKSAPETPIFMLELAPEPPIFHFATAHTYQKVIDILIVTA